MTQRRQKYPGVIALVLIMSLLTALPALAGSGDGTGGGKGEPLRLVSSNPAGGQQDVALPLEIKLTFSKNVVHMTVSDNNRKCFSLYNAAGIAVPAEVVMADDQIEPEKKNDVIIKPLQSLAPGTAYTVKIAPELESKSGVTLGTPVSITFTTAPADAGTTAKEPGVPAGGQPAQGIVAPPAPAPAPAGTGDSSSVNGGKTPGDGVQNQAKDRRDTGDALAGDTATRPEAAPDTPAANETPAAAAEKAAATQEADVAGAQNPEQHTPRGALVILGLAVVAAAAGAHIVYHRRNRK